MTEKNVCVCGGVGGLNMAGSRRDVLSVETQI